MDEKMREADMQKQYQKLADAVGVLLDFIAEGNSVDTNCTWYLAMQKEYFNSVNAGFVEE